MTKTIKAIEISNEDETRESIIQAIEDTSEPAVEEPKAPPTPKRKSRAKPKVVEPLEQIQEEEQWGEVPLEEPTEPAVMKPKRPSRAKPKTPQPVDSNVHEDPSEPIAPKPKRASRAKVKNMSRACEEQTEPEPEPEGPPKKNVKSVTEEKPQEEKPKPNVKVVEQVACEDCGKLMTKKTLQYSHSKICPAKHPPVEKKTKEKPEFETIPNKAVAPPPPTQAELESFVSKSINQRRLDAMKRKSDSIEKLALQIV